MLHDLKFECEILNKLFSATAFVRLDLVDQRAYVSHTRPPITDS